MPFVRIDLPAHLPASQVATISDTVHSALVASFDVPAADRFQTIGRRRPEDMVCSPEYLGVPHAGHAVFVQIACSPGRSIEKKRALYAAIAEGIGARTEISADDVIIHLVETVRENWSFGRGLAHYALPVAA